MASASVPQIDTHIASSVHGNTMNAEMTWVVHTTLDTHTVRFTLSAQEGARPVAAHWMTRSLTGCHG